MTVTNLCSGGWASNCYLLVDATERYALVVDPSVPMSRLTAFYPDGAPSIVGVVLTHTHYDHMLYLEEWCQGGIPVYVGLKDIIGMTDTAYNVSGTIFGNPTAYHVEVHPLLDGDTLSLGDDILTVISTPGHTQGGISLFCHQFVITGDTLFAHGSVGRCDLPGSSQKELQASLQRLLELPPQTKILPGHGAESTIGRERQAHFI